MANLCEALGYARNDSAKLGRILNANLRHERDGKPYIMGSQAARDIELKLKLPTGWMDTPPSIAEVVGENDPLVMIQALLEGMSEDDKRAALRIVAALKEPAAESRNGTHN